MIVQRQLEDGYEVIEVGMPCLLTAVKELNTPRYMSIGGIADAYQKDLYKVIPAIIEELDKVEAKD